MEYEFVSTEEKGALLNGRLRDLEVLHYKQSILHMEAKEPGEVLEAYALVVEVERRLVVLKNALASLTEVVAELTSA